MPTIRVMVLATLCLSVTAASVFTWSHTQGTSSIHQSSIHKRAFESGAFNRAFGGLNDLARAVTRDVGLDISDGGVDVDIEVDVEADVEEDVVEEDATEPHDDDSGEQPGPGDVEDDDGVAHTDDDAAATTDAEPSAQAASEGSAKHAHKHRHAHLPHAHLPHGVRHKAKPKHHASAHTVSKHGHDGSDAEAGASPSPPPHEEEPAAIAGGTKEEDEGDHAVDCPSIHRGTLGCNMKLMAGALHKYFKFRYKGDFVLTAASLHNKPSVSVSSPERPHRKTKLMDATPHLKSLLPRKDSVFSRNFSSCAIVGSSGILLKYKHGKEIDSHEVVMRFNSARTKTFEEHVGSKTTHRLTNSRNFGFRESRSEHVFVHLRTPGALTNLIKALEKRNHGNLYGLNPAWYTFMDRNLKFLSTSGLNGIMMALHRCSRITLYGFHVHPRHGVPYHYYNVKDKPANVGRDNNEWFVVKHLIDHGFVSLGEPCILECNANRDECQKCVRKANAHAEQ